MKRILLIMVLPIFLSSQNWTSVNSFPYNGVHHPITFANDQHAYVITGSNTDNVYKYAPATDSWIQLADFPGGERGYAYGVAIDNKAYMGLGSNSNGYPNDWWEYDMINDSWQQKANLPTVGRNHPAMIALGDKVYMGCGSDDNGNFRDWWEYDIPSDTWIQKADFPAIARHHPFYFAIGDDPYVGFGHSSTGIHKDFFRYDPLNDVWIQLNDFPGEARVAGTQFSYNGKGYVLSGDGDDHGPLDEGEFWEYDPLLDSWTQLPSHPGNAIWAPGCFVIGCNVYFLLGQDNASFQTVFPLNIYKYKLSEDCGCTDPNAYNYSNIATIDDGSCCYNSGCTDPLALNFDPVACYDDGNCIIPVLGCTNASAINFNPNANTTIAIGGSLDNTFSSGGYFNGDQHLIFNANESCIIKSAVFYADDSNNITFELRDNNGNVIDDTTHNVNPGQQTLVLNFEVPVGNDLQLGTSSNSGLYRNNSGASYPYDIGGLISITSSSASTSPYDYYYFYYNIEVEVPCINATSTVNIIDKEKQILKIVDILGRESDLENQLMFYIYDDGTVEKRLLQD